MPKGKKKGPEKELTPALAKALLDAERTAREQRCRQKIEKALAEENCWIEASFIITPQGNIPQVNIRARPETEQ